MISKEELDKMVKTPADMYDACYFNGYYLPSSHKDPLCTMQFLTELFRGIVLVPKKNDI